MAHRQALERLQFLGKMPWDPIAGADDAISGHRDDQ
jgi:hypothetical protein